MCKITIVGKRKGEKQPFDFSDTADKPLEIKRFESTEGTCEWSYLEMEVFPLK
jgi:hypothetical protein